MTLPPDRPHPIRDGDLMTDPTPTSRTSHRRGRTALIAAVAASFLGVSAFAALRPASADEGPEISLKAGDKKVIVSDRPLGTTGDGENGPAKPSDCIDDPIISLTCDAYRLHIDLDPNAEALNFVTLRLEYDTPTTPPLDAVAVGLKPLGAGDLDVGVWDISGPTPVLMAIAGAGSIYNPEIGAFEPEMSDYMVTVESKQAPVVGYTLTASFSNELFSTPFEALDPSLNGPEDRSSVRPTDNSGDGQLGAAPAPASSFGAFDDITPAPAYAGAALAPVAPLVADSDFAGFRTAVDDSLAPPTLSASAASVVVPKPKNPSGMLLVFWLVLVPLLLIGFVAAALRRRRPTALQG